MMRRLCLLFLGALASALIAQPTDAPILPLDEIRPGQRGEVWTVFRGTDAEPFSVEVTGVLRNALGPGKSLILCQLTDPRVQSMGAVAGMSGSPLYIEGRLAGALSYQLQRFETVRHAGFTPVADLIEVDARAATPADRFAATTAPWSQGGSTSPYQALRPVFTLGGLSPAVAELFSSRYQALGLDVIALGGSTQSGAPEGGGAPTGARLQSSTDQPPHRTTLKPGSAVSVALATGDITLAGTGTVSRVDGKRISAFGHPMLSLGDVALPMCAAEVVAILPSNLQSMKLANTGAVIGTITQDRLSAVSGEIGAGPEMIAVTVTVNSGKTPARTLRFSVARQQQLTPTLVATGVSQAILGSNDAGLAGGFRLSSSVRFPAQDSLAFATIYSGPQGFAQGLSDFVQSLAGNLQNPYARTFPDEVAFTIEPLAENPAVTLDLFQVSRSVARAGEDLLVTLAWRDWQGEAHRQIVAVPVDPAWTGRQLEVVIAPGRAMDELAGRPRSISASELRSFGAYLAAMRDERPADGLCLAVVERTTLFSDQTVATPDAPGSFERIARGADEARFRKRDALLPLWEKHLLPGKLLATLQRKPLTVIE